MPFTLCVIPVSPLTSDDQTKVILPPPMPPPEQLVGMNSGSFIRICLQWQDMLSIFGMRKFDSHAWSFSPACPRGFFVGSTRSMQNDDLPRRHTQVGCDIPEDFSSRLPPPTRQWMVILITPRRINFSAGMKKVNHSSRRVLRAAAGRFHFLPHSDGSDDNARVRGKTAAAA